MPTFHVLMFVCTRCPASEMVPATINPDGAIEVVRGRVRDGKEEFFFDQDWSTTPLGQILCPACTKADATKPLIEVS